MVLEDGGGPGLRAANGQHWRYVADTVMGGVSTGALSRGLHHGKPALHLTGAVSLENNGGFVQMALDLAPPGQVLDASRFAGLSLLLHGNDAPYNIHLRSPDMVRVWQSWRAQLHVPARWVHIFVPFSDFTPHRTDLPVQPARLSRIGLVAIGREMRVDLALARLEFV
jgi:hypothetical protein